MGLKESNEITVKLKCKIDEFYEIVEEKGFKIAYKFSMDDTYFIPETLNLDRMNTREILSKAVLVREIKEEIGKDIEITGYISTIENFFEMKGSKYHEIMFVHKVEFVDEKDKEIEYTLENIEGKDYLKYEWLELDKIEQYPLWPKAIREVLKENKFPVHKINNDMK